jgi:hypothetical protein
MSLEISLDQLRRIEGAHLVRLARKGDSAPAVAHKLELSGLLQTPLEVATQACVGGSLGYWLELAPLSLQARLGACTSASLPALPGLESRLNAYRGELVAHRVWDFHQLSVALGVGAGVSVIHQRFETERNAPPRTAAVPFLTIVGRVEWDLSGRWFTALELAAETHFLSLRGERVDPTQRDVNFAFTPALGLGLRL